MRTQKHDFFLTQCSAKEDTNHGDHENRAMVQRDRKDNQCRHMKEERREIEESKDNTVPDTLQTDYIEQLGITLSSITQDVRMRQNIPENVSGLLVTKVEQNTDAEIKGIRPGDIIQEVNQVSVNDINAFRKIINSLKGSKKGVLLLVNRQGNINFVALKLN